MTKTMTLLMFLAAAALAGGAYYAAHAEATVSKQQKIDCEYNIYPNKPVELVKGGDHC